MSVLDLQGDVIKEWSTASNEPEWLTEQRAKAWETYGQLSLPQKTSESWKYTNLERLAGWQKTHWPVNNAATTIQDTTKTPSSMIYCDIATAIAQHGDLIRPYLKTPDYETRFTSANNLTYGGAKYLSQQEALWDRGFFLYVPKSVRVEAPLYGNITCTANGAAIFPRTIIVLEEGAELTFVEEFTSAADVLGTNSCHARAEFYVRPNARLQHITIQRWHNDMRHMMHQQATVDRDAHFTSLAITLGSKVVKTITESQLIAPGAESYMFGLTFGNGKQHIDHHTLQTHLAPNTMSDLLFKTALKDDAQSIYTGLITMAEAAQQGAAYQSCRNLLLSEGCRANAVPQLEIKANDVKCSHGATMGPVNKEQLYYLTSRGLSVPQAEEMIATGFFEDLITRLPDEHFIETVRKAIAHKLGA